MVAGRPPSFDDDDINRLADELIEWTEVEGNYWFKDFCLKRRINPDCMSEWAEKNPKFRGAYNLAKSRQESQIYQGGMVNKYNSNLVKFGLISNHGWTDGAKESQKPADNSVINIINQLPSSKDLVDE